MPEILVREAIGAADVALVRRLMQAYGNYLAADPAGSASICIQGYNEEMERLPEGYLVLLLAQVDGQPAGCVALRRLQLEGPSCEMKRLWVDSGFRGLGLGRLLVEKAIVWAERAGFTAMYLDTVPAAMPEANRLYRAMGFHPVERYNKNPVADVVFFRRSLVSPYP